MILPFVRISVYLFTFKDFILQRNYMFTAKLRRYRDFSYIPVPTHAQPPHYSAPNQGVPLLWLMKLPWHTITTHCPEFMLGFTLGGVISLSVDKYMTSVHYFNIIKYFHCRKTISAASVHYQLPNPTPWQQ